jgi:hypothetical protein
MSVRMFGFVLVAMLLGAATARAQDQKDRFNIRLSLTGMYLTEQELTTRPTGVGREAQVASPFELGYGDLRVVIDGRRLPGRFDLHLDGRVRATGDFSTDTATVGGDQTTARGYLGGREYELRSAWVRRRGDQWDFGFGRMIVAEADALKIDGLRLWWRMAKHWDASVYAGAYPDPFSRSLTTDYPDLAIAAGGDATYTYDKIWGSFSVNGSYFRGRDDGGPLNGTALTAGGDKGNPQTETPRVWITWTDYVRLISWLDLYTDVVFDATGAAGPQLTRLDALLSARAGSHLSIRLGYDHLSAFAIEMWLTRLLYDRTQHAANTIENNLIVERTARDEARGQIDLTFGKFTAYGEGRFRRRALVSLTDDPQFVNAGSQVAPGLAYDATVGARDRGSLAGLRLNLWASYISDYRSRQIIAALELGRSWFEERLAIDLAFLYAKTNDTLAGAGMNGAPPTCDVTSIVTLNAGCYGSRDGAEYEAGLTLSGEPFNHWFAFVDYRLVANQTSGIYAAATGTPGMAGAVAAVPQPTILTHVLLLRIEARY